MIVLNGKKFAENETEFTDSLFEGGGTCVGYAKRLKRQIKITDHNKNIVGVINKHGVLCCATPLDNGKIWYSYADIDLIGKWDYSDMRETIDTLSAGRDWLNYEPIYRFK